MSNNKNMNIIKGIGTGLAAGMMVGFAGAKIMENTTSAKKKVNKTAKSIGEVVDNVQSFFK